MKVLLEGSVDVDSGDPQHLGKKVSRRSFALSDLNEFTGKRRKDDCPRRTLPTSRVVANFHLSPAWSPEPRAHCLSSREGWPHLCRETQICALLKIIKNQNKIKSPVSATGFAIL